MIALALIPIAFVVSTAALFLWFAALTRLRPAHPSLSNALRLSGLWFDVLYNWTFGSIMFLELPREFTFSARLERHIMCCTWRGALAFWVERVFIRPIDPYHLER